MDLIYAWVIANALALVVGLVIGIALWHSRGRG